MSKLRFEIGPGEPKERVDKALARRMPETSRATLQRYIEEGRVSVDGRGCRPKDRVAPGAVIEVEPGPPPASAAEPDPSVPFSVLFEDEHLIVVDKPAGVVMHPARGHHGGTLVNGLLARPGFSRAPVDPRDPLGFLRPGIVHRLDKDTSGVLVVAKQPAAREGLKAQLSARTVERVYWALTCGTPRTGTLSTLHARDPRSRLRFTSRTDSGRPAITHVRVLETLVAGGAALVECRLQTGRTHQIRVHLAEQAKAPILADALYGQPCPQPFVREVAEQLGRQALHAGVLGFIHPVTGAPLRFERPLPEDLARALERLRAGIDR
ncbi:MAG TPA: RluA family pseudouridine synthase [Polyangiaceae bacterium]|nr:RluA family pseudouridine synthase [Polyangiaceae bacterium]